ncbi:ABC transporter permease [Paenibacillus thiaminolyticus]|uniref:ABC transporter permease n=1 Tax=Paenibacillus thiaminolyticus TaxID=49283 RepID=UPI0023501847|nr:ABC transporter permease [Paenibacillus thiaminolyticus]MDG0871622.1 ABC transporter permease [Paenibacillus thiaminolyticus]WCR29512.1 ABC transporter permease [Paenibacillus thiaminolyticus]
MSGFMLAMQKSVELGVLYALMALGVYLTFRILDFPDLTVDGSFTTGAAIAALCITSDISPWIGTALAFLGGGLAGMMTGIIHTKGKINPLLSGILMMIALHSINLRIMGKANIGLMNSDTLLTPITGGFLFLIVMGLFAVLVKLALDWFLRTEVGLSLRATGNNPRMIRSFGVHTDTTIVAGVSLSNALVALSGALVAQYQGFADIQSGVGMIVVGLASVIIGEAIFGHRTIARATLAVLLGAVLYRVIVAIALQLQMNATDLKLFTALIVIVALTVPKMRRSANQRKMSRQRMMQLAKGGQRDAASESGQ